MVELMVDVRDKHAALLERPPGENRPSGPAILILDEYSYGLYIERIRRCRRDRRGRGATEMAPPPLLW